MIMNVWKKRIALIVSALALNILGRFIALSFDLPAYFTLCGTILASYLSGAFAGGIVAILSCAICSIAVPTDWYFLISDIAVAVAAALLARKNRYFASFSPIISATAFFAVVKGVVLLVIDILVYNGRTGLVYGDAIVDYLASVSAYTWLCYLVAALFVAFADSLCAMFLIYFGMAVHRNYGKRRRALELKKQLNAKTGLSLLLAAILSLSVLPLRAEAESSISFVEKLYNSDNGLTGGCVNDIAMTRDGTMWIATYGGLFRFNGSKFVLIDNLKSVRSVQTLYVDNEDRLWAGTQDAGVTLLNIDMSFTTLDMNNGLPSNSVKCISRDSNGLYYFGTTAGLVIAEYVNGVVHILQTDKNAGNIRDLSADPDGHMVVMNNVGEVSCYEAGKVVARFTPGSITPRSITHDAQGNLYIGTDSGTILICEYFESRIRATGTILCDDVKSIRDLYFDDNDSIYLASDSGIGYLDSSRRLTMIESGTFNNSIDHIFKDYQGNLWFTSSRCGLLCLGRSSFTDVFKLCGEKGIVSNAVKDWNGYLYVGTNSGLKILNASAGESIQNELTELLDGIRIRCLDVSVDGNLLVATYENGVMEVKTDGTASEYVNPRLTDKAIRLVKCLSDGTVISSSDGGVTFMKDHNVVSRLELGEDLRGGTVLNILETEDHTLLCGTDGDGIAVLKDGKLDRYITREDGLSSGVVLRVVRDVRGEGYFVLTGSGLCYMDPDFGISELGMPYYNNFDLAQNSAGEVFVLGGAGIYICDYDSLMTEGRMESYALLDTKAGLPGSITSNAWNYITDDEKIYFCGTTGVYLLDLNNYEMRVDDFKTKITSVKRDGVYEDVTQIGHVDIPKGTGRFEVDMEINNFTSADPYVSYFLSGVDDEKTTVLSSKLGSVTYIDIPYGNHDFIIKVLDDKGRELSSQTYVFAKGREIYETLGFLLYFYVLLFAFIAFIVTSIVQGAVMAQRKKDKGRHELVVTKLENEKAEALERALHMEEDANRSKSEFLANMSHEIRTPINAIIGMDTMIMRETHEANIRNYARDIHSAGKTLLSLINDILDFSKIESGKLELVLEEYELSTVINGIVNMIAPKAESKKLALEVNVNPEIPNWLYGDEVRIEQIIINILNNAVKYTEKGKVTLNVDYREADGGAILLQVSVADTGIGIKSEDLEKLFSPYARIEEQRNKKIEGTGLGMSITKDLLEKMGSRLEVSSVYGEGSTFSFELSQPVSRAEAIGDYRERAEEQDTNYTDVEKFHAPDAKLLVVDDVEMNLIVAMSLLKRIRVQVDTAQSGREAIEKATAAQYDMILLDSMMPEMNGEETMQNIRSSCPLNAETPIIVLTAHAVKGAREEYLRLGYDNYLAKPLDGVKLEAMIQSYLPDEKIIFVDGEEAEEELTPVREESAENAEQSEELARISCIMGIEAEKGVETAGGEDAYLLICRNFRDTAKMRIGMIREAFEKEDYENYTIHVHALKSSARLIGAFELSAEALELETAGREGETDLIRERTAGIIEKYEWFYEKLDEVFSIPKDAKTDDRPLLSKEELEDNLSEMAELLEAFDMDTAKELLDSLEEYRLPEECLELYESLKAQMAELNRDGCLELIRGGKE
ncbi:MAG: response regulator [Lachnospiraceae bacterium]|nr:response regulator [Lachnospiraceae bacterium]